MRFMVLCICIGFSIGATIRTQRGTKPTQVSIKDAESLNPEPFEVISLSSHNVREPLIIRSRIPESDRLSSSTLEAAKSSGLDTLSTVNMVSMSDFESLLDYDSTLGAGVMSFDENNAKSSKNTFTAPEQRKINDLLLEPAQLQFETVGNSDSSSKNVSTKHKKPQENIPPNANEKPGYTIEAVPVVASYSRVGPFSSADIPSIEQIEAIFRTHKTKSESRQNLEGRPGLADIGDESGSVEATTTEIATETEPTLTVTIRDSLLDQKISPVALDSDIISNEIDSDSKLLESTAFPTIVSTIKPTESSTEDTTMFNEELKTTTNVFNPDDTTVETTTLEANDVGLFGSSINEDSETVFTSIPVTASEEVNIQDTTTTRLGL